MKVFISAFYGRIAQYSKGIEIYRSKNDKSLLQQTILNNIYKGKKTSEQNIDFFINYMHENINHFMNTNELINLKNRFRYINLNYKR